MSLKVDQGQGHETERVRQAGKLGAIGAVVLLTLITVKITTTVAAEVGAPLMVSTITTGETTIEAEVAKAELYSQV